MKETNLENLDVKNCAYDGCANTILANSEFKYCEVCRTLVLRNTNAILSEPTTPFLERHDYVMENMFHLMRPEEKLNWSHKLESIYLTLRKEISGKEMESYRRTQLNASLEDVHEKRERTFKTDGAKKRAKKRETKDQRLLKLLDGDKDAFKSITDTDFGDL